MIRTPILEAVTAAIRENGAPFGGLDLRLTASDRHDEIVLAHLFVLLSIREGSDPYFSRVRLVLPAGLSWDIESALRGCIDSRHVDSLLSRTEVVPTADRRPRSLIEVAAGMPERGAILYVRADLYAPTRPQPAAPDAVQDGTTGEQVRFFQTERLVAEGLVEVGREIRPCMSSWLNPYVLLVAGCGPLVEFEPLLASAFDTLAAFRPPGGDPITMHDVTAWSQRLKDGDPPDVVRAAIASAMADDRAVDHLHALALSLAGRPVDAYTAFSRHIGAAACDHGPPTGP